MFIRAQHSLCIVIHRLPPLPPTPSAFNYSKWGRCKFSVLADHYLTVSVSQGPGQFMISFLCPHRSSFNSECFNRLPFTSFPFSHNCNITLSFFSQPLWPQLHWLASLVCTDSLSPHSTQHHIGLYQSPWVYSGCYCCARSLYFPEHSHAQFGISF